MSPWIDPKTKSRSFLSSWLVINLRDSWNHVIDRVIFLHQLQGCLEHTRVPLPKHKASGTLWFPLCPCSWCVMPPPCISFLFPLLCFTEVKLHPVKMHTSYTYNWMSFDNSKVDTHVPTPKSRKRTFLSHRKPAYISLRPTSHPETILSLLSIYSLTVFHVVSLTPIGCSNFIFFILFPFWLCHKACGILVP